MPKPNIRKGDFVEFCSDSQTDKGPSSGRCISRTGRKVVIRHSDHPGEEFDLDTLAMVEETTHHRGGKLWMLE